VTLPPGHFFSGCDLAIARDHVLALRELGAIVYEFDTTLAYSRNHAGLQQQLDDLRAFRPDVAIGAPHGGYALQPFTAFSRGPDPNTTLRHPFLDDLELPTFFYWDHALLQIPRYLADRWPKGPDDSTVGVLDQLRALFNHPRALHFFPDSGQIAELHRLGIAELPAHARYVPGISHQYVEEGSEHHSPGGTTDSVAFFGNIYIAAARRIKYAHEALYDVRQRALVSLEDDWDRAPYHAYVDEVERLSPTLKAELRLGADDSFRWRFLFDELGCFVNGERRFRHALACGRPLTYFGGFADPESRAIVQDAGCILADEYLPYGRTLAAAYRRQAVSIDVGNAPYFNGFSTKLFSCFAAGGFMLTSRKADLTAALGSLADAISFSTAAELAAKVDHFLTARHERRELADHIKEAVRDHFTASSLFARTVPALLETLRAYS
jgi:hypothetical protein